MVGLYFYPNKVVEVAKHTYDSLSEASTFIEVLEKRQDLKVACLEGIAYRQGWITAEQLKENAQPMLKNDYGKYLLSILEEKDQTLKKNLEYLEDEEYHYHGRCWFHRLTCCPPFREQIS